MCVCGERRECCRPAPVRRRDHRMDCAKLGERWLLSPVYCRAEVCGNLSLYGGLRASARKRHAAEPPLGRQVLAAHNCVLLTGNGNRLAGFATWDDDCMKSIGYQSMSWPTTMPRGTIAIPSPSRVRSFWSPRANVWRFRKPSSSVSPAPTLKWYEFPHKTGLAGGNQADAHERTHV
jgi:hypothetical protein